MLRRVLLTGGVLAGLVFALAAPSFGGPGGRTSGDAVLLVDADGGAPMFRLPGLPVGAPYERCIAVTNAGTRTVAARLFAHARGRLGKHVRVEITRGASLPGVPFPGCTGFIPDASIQRGLGPGVIDRGTLAGLSARYAGATLDPGLWPAGATRGYRFTVTLMNLPRRHHPATTASFVWKARGA